MTGKRSGQDTGWKVSCLLVCKNKQTIADIKIIRYDSTKAKAGNLR